MNRVDRYVAKRSSFGNLVAGLYLAVTAGCGGKLLVDHDAPRDGNGGSGSVGSDAGHTDGSIVISGGAAGLGMGGLFENGGGAPTGGVAETGGARQTDGSVETGGVTASGGASGTGGGAEASDASGACTDVDCGGACAPCDLGRKCGVDADCASAACDAVSLTCIANSCADHQQDRGETDADCGGPCAPCAIGQMCLADADCALPACDAVTLTCVSNQCNDHRKDGDEVDVDCGGGESCLRCAPGRTCASSTDCRAGHRCSTDGTHVCL